MDLKVVPLENFREISETGCSCKEKWDLSPPTLSDWVENGGAKKSLAEKTQLGLAGWLEQP